MMNWMQTWWQVRQSWSFVRHAYRCGWSLYDDAADAWSQCGYALAYTAAQLTPQAKLMPIRA
jgi:hypothetical protein